MAGGSPVTGKREPASCSAGRVGNLDGGGGYCVGGCDALGAADADAEGDAEGAVFGVSASGTGVGVSFFMVAAGAASGGLRPSPIVSRPHAGTRTTTSSAEQTPHGARRARANPFAAVNGRPRARRYSNAHEMPCQRTPDKLT